MSEFHMDMHRRERTEAMAVLQNMPPRSPSYYQRLRLNWADINFLRSRGIGLDEDTFYDKEAPYKNVEAREVKNWSKILERAWPL